MKKRVKTRFCKSLSKRWSFSIFLIVVFALILTGNAYANTIPGLFNTGVDDAGEVFPFGDLEIHYSMTGPLFPAIVATPNPLWVTATENSAWIGPTSGFITDPLGDYTYTLTFDLTGLDPTTAIISGEWATDNTTVLILNGINTGLQFNNVLTLSPFEVSDGFISGINELQFVVTNNPGSGSNPTGLLVANLDGQASPVPIPASVWLLMSGFAGLLGVLRHRRKR